MVEKYRFDLLTNTKTCYRYLQIGFAIIAVTFLIGILALVETEFKTAYEILVMPALFVGLAFLLFGVGTHLHIMHLNLVRMMDMDEHD